MRYEKGFTLIELLLVVGIVTLLSSVLFYNTSEAKKKAEDSHMQAEAQQIKTAVSLYRNDTGRYPLTSTGRTPSSRRGVLHSESDPDSDYMATMQELVDGGYISEIPRSPDGQSYAYGLSSTGEEAMFVATLKRSGFKNSSNSCEFVYKEGETIPPPVEPPTPCYVVPGVTGTCTTVTQDFEPYFETQCEGAESCREVEVTPPPIYSLVCTPSTPSQTICPPPRISEGGPRIQEPVVCDGSHESDYCQCI